VRHRLKTAFRRLAVATAVTLVLASAGTMGGCDNEGEGERCTYFPGGDAGENGTSECSSGLVCKATDYYATTSMTTTPGVGALGVCCPPAGVATTAVACMPAVGGSTTGGRPTGDGSFDAGGDGASTDAGDATTRDATSLDATLKDATTGG
jgi:hypothetical protein